MFAQLDFLTATWESSQKFETLKNPEKSWKTFLRIDFVIFYIKVYSTFLQNSQGIGRLVTAETLTKLVFADKPFCVWYDSKNLRFAPVENQRPTTHNTAANNTK